MLKLSEQEIKQRLKRLRNLERLYPKVKNEKQRLKDRVLELENIVLQQSSTIEKQQLRIEELEKMVFGSKGKKKKDKGLLGKILKNKKRKFANRTSNSYRRPQPQDDEITDTQEHPLLCCPDCQGKLTKIKIVERYIEDILPLAEWFKALKRIVKHRITTGYCKHCQARKTAKPFTSQISILGENIKQYVSFATTIQRLSYEQIKDFLKGTLRFNISDGEITNILTRHGIKLRPEFEAIKSRIRGQPGSHYDESTWKVQQEEDGNYAWIQTGTQSEEAVFILGRSRGKGNAQELQGQDNLEQVGISDDYGAYKNMFEYHQLCWAHPHRKLRDLKDSDKLSSTKKEHCLKVFESFATLYHDIQDTIKSPFNAKQWQIKKQKFITRFDEIIIIHPNDPAKLVKIKERLQERKEHYFTCLTRPGIPCDNNKAERGLRHLVLKRRMCFGSRTQKAADMMSVLYTVLLSKWWTSKETFFTDFATLLEPAPAGQG